MDESHLFQRCRGREGTDTMDVEAYAENDGRSKTNTTLLAHDAETKEKEDYYERLAILNDGMYASERDWQNVKADRRRLVETYGSHLELTTPQEERMKHFLQSISMKFGQYSYEKVILAFVSLVCNETGRNIRREPMYQQFMETMEISDEKIGRLRELSLERLVDADDIVVSDRLQEIVFGDS